MNNLLIFNPDQVDKFFSILKNMGRTCCDRYKGYDKLNPHISPCEREVFTKRTVSKWFKGKFVIIYEKGGDMGVPQKKYYSINSIVYALDYGLNLSVYVTDFANPYNFTSIKVSNKIRSIEGRWSTDGREHSELLRLISLDDLPDREFVYSGFDFNKYPKRKKKDQTEDDIRKLMEVENTIVAKIQSDADEQIVKLQDKSFLLNKLKEVREL